MSVADAQAILALIAARLSGQPTLPEQLAAVEVQKAAEKLGDVERESRTTPKKRR